MSLSGNLVIENFGWSNPEEVELPGVDPATGQLTGQVLKRKVLRIQALDSGVVIEIRVDPADWDRFIASLSGRTVQVVDAGALAQLRRNPDMNGGG